MNAQARRNNHQARGGQRTYRGSRRSFSEHAVHRPRPRHQPDGAGLGEHDDGPPEGAFPVLGEAFEAARLPAAVPDRRLAGRNAWGHRHDAGVGLAASPELRSECFLAFSRSLKRDAACHTTGKSHDEG